MKILIVHHCDSWGGAGVSLRDLCNMLMSEHRVTVLLPHIDSPVASVLKTDCPGIKLLSLEMEIGMISSYNGGPNFISRTFYRNFKRIKRSRRLFVEVLKADNYSIVILNSMTISWALKPIEKMKMKGICYVRETKINNPGFFLIKHYINKYARGVLFISEYDRDEFNLKVLMSEVIRDCSNFQNVTIPHRIRCDDNEMNVIFLGGSEILKGYEVCLAAMDYLRDYRITLFIVGNVSEECQERNRRSNIVYMGHFNDVSLAFDNKDVLLFPSVEGHQGRPIFEAGFFRIPVIVSNFPCVKYEVKNGVNGLLFEPMNAYDLSQKILMYYKNEDLRRGMGEENYRNSIERHSFESNARLINKFVMGVVLDNE